MKRIGNIPDSQLKEEIQSGKRSGLGEMTQVEMDELVALIKEDGGIAELKGSVLKTNRPDLHNKYVEEYVMRKLTL